MSLSSCFFNQLFIQKVPKTKKPLLDSQKRLFLLQNNFFPSNLITDPTRSKDFFQCGVQVFR